MMNVKEAAELWGISVRRVQDLCAQGKIDGAKRFGLNWMIPSDAKRPLDRRYKKHKNVEKIKQMPKRSPLLAMTNLYGNESELVKCNDDIKDLFYAEVALYQGDIPRALALLNEKSVDDKDIYYRVGKSLLLSQCAVWEGNIQLWNEATQLILEINPKTEEEKSIIELTQSILYCLVMIRPSSKNWFNKGNFERVPADTQPLAKVYYSKLLYIVGIGVATKQLEFYDSKGLNLMNMLSFTIEPMITQAVVDQTIIPEIYLRLCCAISYRFSNKNEDAIYHLDKALKLALENKLYGILAEFWYRYDNLLVERLTLMDEASVKEVRALFVEYYNGWSELSGVLKNKTLATNLSDREREIAKLISYGFTNKQIAKMVGVSEQTVKSTVKNIMNKTGLNARSDFFTVL